MFQSLRRRQVVHVLGPTWEKLVGAKESLLGLDCLRLMMMVMMVVAVVEVEVVRLPSSLPLQRKCRL